MKPRLGDLIRLSGSLDRGTYLFWGLVLGLLKFNLDRWAVGMWGLEHWRLWSYWIPGDVFGMLSQAGPRHRFAPELVLLALPFIYVGVALTLRRLRALGWPLWLVVLFFVPIVNLVFFALLSILPSRPAAGRVPSNPEVARKLFVARLVPESRLGSAVTAILLTAILGATMTWFFTSVLVSYAWGVFFGIPFFLGLFSTLVYTVHHPRTWKECVGVTAVTVAVLSGLLLGLAMEGVVCILMAFPVALVLALLGTVVGRMIVSLRTSGRDRELLAWMLVLLTPGLLAAEASEARGPGVYSVVDEVRIEAPPQDVWRTLKAIDALSAPKPWLLRIGLPVPVRCTLEGEEVGARRTCFFEKGRIEERVLEWDPPRRMRLEIVRSTLPGRHWLGFREAIYDLEAEGTGTRLRRTTTYTSLLEPRWYWDALERIGIRAIHRYVLDDLQARFNKHVPGTRP